MENAVTILAIVCFFVTGVSLLGRVSIEKAWEFVVACLFSIGISGLLVLILLTR